MVLEFTTWFLSNRVNISALWKTSVAQVSLKESIDVV